MQKTWQITPFDRTVCGGLSKALNISPLFSHLLLERGIADAEAARRFISRTLSSLHDPFLLKDMEKALDRLDTAIKKRQQILIYGDYDVDGLTATTLLFTTLKRCGADVAYYIPHRVSEGYGLNIEALGAAVKDGVGLVIAVDCGITSLEEIDFLKKQNIDCIILDHHEPLACSLPAAVAIINPLQQDCGYPYKSLASVGLVFKLAQALKEGLKVDLFSREYPIEEDLDLVALGTISDVAPLTGENRILVSHGLKHLYRTRKTGLRALIEVAGIGKKREFYTDAVGFILGPRLNASGRMSSSLQSLKLLLTRDEAEARGLAEGLDRENRARQALEETILKEAVSKVEREVNFKEHRVIVVASDRWHPGIIGIVASRLVDKFYRPAFLIAFKDDMGKGSGRSIRNFHLFDALSRCKEDLIEYGGHQYAAGITISKGNLDKFRARLNDIAHEVLKPLDLVPQLNIDAEISLSDLTLKFVKELESLEPFGVGNPKPVFLARGLSLKSRPRMINSSTVQMWVTDGRLTYEAVGFKRSFDFKSETAPANFSLAFNASLNNWQGREEIKLQIKDLRS